MNLFDFRHVATVEDKSGELLRCEFTAWMPTEDLRVQATPEIKLRNVIFNNGAGVEVVGGADHARFLTIIRQDPTFSEHLDWPQIQGACEQAFLLGQSTPAARTFEEANA